MIFVMMVKLKIPEGFAKLPTHLALPKKRKMLKLEKLKRDQNDLEILGNTSKANIGFSDGLSCLRIDV